MRRERLTYMERYRQAGNVGYLMPYKDLECHSDSSDLNTECTLIKITEDDKNYIVKCYNGHGVRHVFKKKKERK